jgi:hypothetical protein
MELTSDRQIRNFVKKFYHFIEGVAQHHRNIDELLSKAGNPFFPSETPS